MVIGQFSSFLGRYRDGEPSKYKVTLELYSVTEYELLEIRTLLGLPNIDSVTTENKEGKYWYKRN